MRLIDADAMKTVKAIQSADFNSIETIRAWIDAQPTIEERKTGEWECTTSRLGDIVFFHFKCPICGHENGGRCSNYCPYCGAKMGEAEA